MTAHRNYTFLGTTQSLCPECLALVPAKILDRGGAITAPLGVPGLSGSARFQLPNSAAPSYEATITFDVMEFVKSR